MVSIGALSPHAIEKIKVYRWDRIIEKHEGPETWESVLKYYDPEFMVINGYNVLLPIVREHHGNITILRCIIGDHEQVLTIFLKDTTYSDDPEWEKFAAGFVAVCERVAEEDFFVAILYHEWFIIDDNP
jgi:hypothetical protein